MERDFTYKKYKEVCRVIKNVGYKTLTIAEYLKNYDEYQNANFIIIRHDIDNKVDLQIALKMAEYENSLGIKASYYFRIIEDTYNKSLIKKIYQLNHEIGYHFEVLNESKGDIKKAIDLFSMHLNEFRKTVPIETICQHGGSLGEDTASSFRGLLLTAWKIANNKIKLISYRSNDIWKYKSMKSFDIIGEAYLSIDFNKIIYLSDTGLKWDGYKSRVLDVVDSYYYKEKQVIAKTTNDLIHLIKERRFERINLLVHPANWIDPFFPWLKWRSLQVFRNIGKRIALK